MLQLRSDLDIDESIIKNNYRKFAIALPWCKYQNY